MIPYGRQDITQDDIDAVVSVLKSDFLTQGPEIEKFEHAFQDYTGARFAVAVSSCTAALHLAYLALEIQSGDIVWTVPNSFVATANAALYCGAVVDFIDIDPDTYNLSLPALEKKLIEAEASNKLPKLVVPVHFSGQSCDMTGLHALAKKYNFKVVEDAAHASGGSYRGKRIGSCEYSQMACFSFHPVKIITSAEGGIITTNDESLYNRLLRLRTHGITKDAQHLLNKNKGPWYFEQQDLGYHYRMTDLQAALVNSQLKRIDNYIARRTELVALYNEFLKDLNLKSQSVLSGCEPSWHLYTVRVPTDRDTIFTTMREAGVLVNLHYIPIYRHPYYETLGYSPSKYPEMEQYYNETLTLPLFPKLEDEQVKFVCDTLRDVMTR